MLQIVLMLVVVAVIGLVVIASRRPDEFLVSRSAAISAPVAAVFEQVNTLRNWDGWSPWAKLDPNAQNTFEGPESGVGAKMSWAGNHKVGVGGMTIAVSRPDEFIQFKLEFQKPFKGTNIAEFSFKSEANQTIVTWSMSGKNDFKGKAIGLLMNCEKMVGAQFEQGLANLKALVEAAA